MEEDDEWTILSLDKLSQKDVLSPIKNDSVEVRYQSIPVAQATPLLEQYSPSQNEDFPDKQISDTNVNQHFTDRLRSKDQEDTIAFRRVTSPKVSQNTNPKIKYSHQPTNNNWGFTPRNMAIIFGISCLGFIGFLAIK
jgi:hypothetical protein